MAIVFFLFEIASEVQESEPTMSTPNRPVTLVALTLWAVGSVVLAYAGNGICAKMPTASQARTAERQRPPKELEAVALKAIATQYNLPLALKPARVKESSEKSS